MASIIARFRRQLFLFVVAYTIGWGQAAFGATATGPASMPGGPRPDQAWAELRSAIGSEFDSRLAQLQRYARLLADDPAVAAQSCLAFAALEERTRDGTFLPQLTELANALVANRDRSNEGRVGWGFSPKRPPGRGCKNPGEFDAFGDGTCNAANTKYAFETGLAAMCLVRTYLTTGDTHYLDTATSALDDSWDVGTAPAGCPNCFYYWYSYDANDLGRYVRNTNVLMGAAAAWLWKATGVSKYRERAEQVVASERREYKAANGGYYGIDDLRYRADPKGEAQRVENHVPWISKGLLDIARNLDDQPIVDLALAIQNSWQNCSSAVTCKENCALWAADASRCRESATASPCFFKNVSANLASLCEAAMPTLLRGALTPTMWWALVDE